MKNLYHKFTACVCTALGFALGANERAYSATFTLAPTTIFGVYSIEGVENRIYLGDGTVVKKIGQEFAEFVEFNIGGFSLAPNTVISSAIFQAQFYGLARPIGNDKPINPGSLGIFGYVGNGKADASDFEAGIFLSSVDISSSSFGDILSFDVSPFVNQRVSNDNAFAGFGIRALNYGGVMLADDYGTGMQPKLIVETADVAEPVPEPTTILSAAIALGWGGWLKRKNSIKQNKTTP